MLPSRLPRPLRIALYAAATAVLLWLCLAPSDQLPQPENLGDKAEHGIAWFVLTLSGLVLAPRRPWAIAGFAAALAVGVEILQGLMGLGRHADWRDLVADAVGLAAALVLWRLALRKVAA